MSSLYGLSTNTTDAQPVAVKLVICDVDGTILKYKSHMIDREYFDVIKKLDRKNIVFAVASGRPYHFLKEIMAPVFNCVYFISSDGAQLTYCDNIISQNSIDRNLADNFINLLPEKKNIIFACNASSYILNGTQLFINSLNENTRNNLIRIDSLFEIRENILKMSVYGLDNDKKKILSDELDISYNSNGWCEYVIKGTDKLFQIKELCRIKGIDKEETMAFGDGENDICVLDYVKYPFAMLNSDDNIQRRYKNHTGSVLFELRRRLL